VGEGGHGDAVLGGVVLAPDEDVGRIGEGGDLPDAAVEGGISTALAGRWVARSWQNFADAKPARTDASFWKRPSNR